MPPWTILDDTTRRESPFQTQGEVVRGRGQASRPARKQGGWVWRSPSCANPMGGDDRYRPSPSVTGLISGTKRCYLDVALSSKRGPTASHLAPR